MVSNEIPALTPDELLTTTRTIRKRMDFERPVSRDVIEECLTLAMQAPNGSNMQSWEWLLIDDADMRCKVADIYRAAMADHIRELQEHPENYPKTDYSDEAGQRMFAAVAYLNENLHRAPVLVIPTFGGRTETASVFLQASMWGSILPAVWNFMLALRSRGMGSAWTTSISIASARWPICSAFPSRIARRRACSRWHTRWERRSSLDAGARCRRWCTGTGGRGDERQPTIAVSPSERAARPSVRPASGHPVDRTIPRRFGLRPNTSGHSPDLRHVGLAIAPAGRDARRGLRIARVHRPGSGSRHRPCTGRRLAPGREIRSSRRVRVFRFPRLRAAARGALSSAPGDARCRRTGQV